MIAIICACLVGVLHIGIMILEMFGKLETQVKAFEMPADFIKQPHAKIALENMGIYNGVLGLMILLSVLIFSGTILYKVLILWMIFVLIVGIFGGRTVTPKIYLIQALPAAITLFLLFKHLFNYL